MLVTDAVATALTELAPPRHAETTRSGGHSPNTGPSDRPLFGSRGRFRRHVGTPAGTLPCHHRRQAAELISAVTSTEGPRHRPAGSTEVTIDDSHRQALGGDRMNDKPNWQVAHLDDIERR